jgi:hypothetical protein
MVALAIMTGRVLRTVTLVVEAVIPGSSPWRRAARAGHRQRSSA